MKPIKMPPKMVPENARNQDEIDLMLGKIPFDKNQFILCTFFSPVHDLGTMWEGASLDSQDIFQRKLLSKAFLGGKK